MVGTAETKVSSVLDKEGMSGTCPSGVVTEDAESGSSTREQRVAEARAAPQRGRTRRTGPNGARRPPWSLAFEPLSGRRAPQGRRPSGPTLGRGTTADRFLG